MWPAWASVIKPVNVEMPAAGSYNSELLVARKGLSGYSLAVVPPAMSTSPLVSSVAVWFQRATSSGLSSVKVCAWTGCRSDKLSASAVNARANGRILLVLIFMILLASEVDSCQSGADGGNA